MNQIINMFVRIVMRRVINSGINAGIGAASGYNNRRKQNDPDDASQQVGKNSQPGQKPVPVQAGQAKKMARMARRFTKL